MRRSAALKTYREKRDFARTTEPEGKARRPAARPSPGYRYVIQKHDARRLHFDFRLELDGVLKSWAVTRGPSLDPSVKRLAVRTEDHPVEYGSFEGTIPKGQYGAGTVMLWDEGTWRPQGDPHEGLKKGVLKFELDGKRLKGGFALVRLRDDAKGKRENWLLVKERDRYAEPATDPVQRWTRSVATGRDLPEIAAGDADPPARGRSHPNARPPEFVAPELATLVATPPGGNDWLHEIKFDGYRAIAAIGGGRVRIYTRSGQDWTKKFATVAQALAKLDVKSALLDGEIVVLDEEGRSSFARLQHGLKEGNVPLTYYVFDLLELDERNLRREPLIARKQRLRELLEAPPAGIRLSDHVVGHGDQVFAKACRLGLEGIVSKRADSPYLSRRTKSWLKAKCEGNDEFVIGGYRRSDKKGRPFASLLLGEYEGKDLRYRGRVGTGFDETDLEELGRRFAKLERKTSPFLDAPREIAKDASWVEPRLVAQIAFTEKTREGRLRHPAFLGLRGDKPAKAVQTLPVADMANEASDSDLAGVRLTSPSKVLFVEAGITKAELAKYLLSVSGRMLPHVAGRPLSLVRCPEGTAGERFFQKHIAKGMPRALHSVPIEESDGELAKYLMIDSPAGLVSAAQIGGLELHIWGAHAESIEHPDRMVFDLDPDGGVDFADVCEAARDVRKLLKAARLESYPLVTGGKGVHVVVPLDGSQGWDEVKAFAKGVASKLAESEPGRFTATMSKAKRKGRIFIDWLRNERGATAIAPYSPRAKGIASVAMPVSWAALARVARADAFTIPEVQARVARSKSDPWSGYFALRQRIGADTLRFFTSG
jgi:bifunctional non-homologous end joining protein LigD